MLLDLSMFLKVTQHTHILKDNILIAFTDDYEEYQNTVNKICKPIFGTAG